MNAPQIWILTPVLLAILLFLLRKNRRFTVFAAGGICAFLAVLALTVKIDQIFSMGPKMMEINSTFDVLGRAFIIEDGDRFLVALMYAMGALWFFGARISSANEQFVPNGLGIIALLIGAFSVQPFLYAALLIEIAVLISIPMLVEPGKLLEMGISRYLIFQTLAVPFILLAGWGFEYAAVSSNAAQVNQFAAVLLGFGFSFWLAVFPFYTWVPLLAEAGHPYVAGFIFAAIPTTVQLMLADFLDTYLWLRNTTLISSAAQLMGIVMIVITGLWAAFHKSILRLFGYLILVETGFSLVSFSLNTQLGWEAFFSSIPTRIVAIALCSLSISVLRVQKIPLHLDSMGGLFYSHPLSTIAFLTGWFSLSGFPLFPSFPIRLALLTHLSENSIHLALWALVGTFGLFFASFRMISIFFSRTEKAEIKLNETPIQAVFLIAGVLILVVVGIFPNIYAGFTQAVMDVYSNLH